MITVTNVFGPLNKGDWELFSRLVDILGENFPDEKVCAIARDKELTQEQFGTILVEEQIGKVEAEGGVGKVLISLILIFSLLASKFDWAIRLLPMSQRESLRKIKDSRLIIACPGGFLEDSTFSYVTHVVQLLVASLYGKKIILAPMSIGPVRSLFGRLLLKFVLKKCDKIFVREGYSKEFVESLGVSCILSDDMAFQLLSKEIEGDDASDTYSWIACTVIDWNFPLSKNKISDRENYINSVAAALNSLQEKYSLPIYFILQVETDIQAIRDVSERIEGDYTIGSSEATPSEVIDLLRKSRFMIASRFHSYIFSMVARCPSVAISYLPKTQYMLKMYALDSNSVDIYDVSSKKLLDVLFATDADFQGYLDKIEDVSHVSSKRRLEFTKAISNALYTHE